MSALPIYEYTRDGYTISTDPARLDADAIHAYLSHSYWAANRPKELVVRSLQHSLCFGLYTTGEQGEDQQIGLARVITDYSTFMYLCDVYVLEEHRGRGLGKWLMDVVMNCPALKDVRQWTLFTQDAHGLYARHGFQALPIPEKFMVYVRV